jgi:tRNA(Ile)-lysidine synthase
MGDLIQPFRSTLRRLSRPGDRLVVAVSGGADSVALLDLADRCRPGLRVQLVVAHLDHGWRDASVADAEFVRELAASRGLPCVVERADGIPMTETAGRDARLAFFARVCADHHSAGVLLGHTADDQCETVLMHLLRGSGLEGGVGLSDDVRVGALRLMRPLLHFRRAEIRSYCARRRLAFREDPTNADPRFLRNRIRHELLPLLDELAPGAVRAIARFAETASADADVVRAAVECAWPRTVVDRVSGAVEVDRAAFRREQIGVQRGLLRRIGGILLGPASDLGFERVEAARLALVGGRGGSMVEWPARVTLRVSGRSGTFSRSPA